MRLSTRLTFAMMGLVLLTAGTFALLTYRHIETSTVLIGLFAVAGILGLTVLLAHVLTRPLTQMAGAVEAFRHDAPISVPISAAGEIGIIARAFDRLATETRDTATRMIQENEQRRDHEAALEKHAEHQRMFIAAVKSASYPIITKTLDGVITAWNPAAERLYKYTAAEAIGENIGIIVPPDRHEEYLALIEKSCRGEMIENFETVRLTKEGRRIDVSLNICPVKSSSGEIVGVAKITRDITAQKFAEEKFRLAVESCPSGMVMIDRSGKIVMVNTEIERLFGYRRDELIGQSVDILVPERFRSDHIRHRSEFTDCPETRRMGAGRDLFGRRKDGAEFPVEVGLNPIHTREGLLVLSVIVDISERKQAEEMFRLAVEACPSGMVIIDRSGKLAMVNSEIERLFGYSRNELIGQSVDILVPERLRSQHVRHRNEFTERPETRRMGAGRDLFGLRKDGTEFPVEVGLNPIRVGTGLLVLGVIVDITERKRLERLKDEFVSSVSHELRTPLTSISGSLGLLVGNAAGSLPDPAGRLLAIAHANSQRLVRLINDILDIEKMEAGQVTFNFSRVEVRPLVEQTIEANRGYAHGYGVQIRLEDGCTDDEVRADPDRLAQVVTNLLSNAIKFSPSGGEVAVAIERRNNVVRFSVRDYGPGIPAGFKARIFEKFAQADATNARQKGGTGLGLSIVKQIVDRLDGEVGFADAPGGGTIFHVELPCWELLASAAIDRDAQPDALRILLCEDDPDTAIALREQLSQVGFATDFAYTASDAIGCATVTRYRAILVDLQLPDGDGITLILRLRELPQYRDTPIIVVSADPSRGRDDSRSSRLNVLDWLNKPVDFDHLIQILTKPAAQDVNRRPRILHVDNNKVVARALSEIADVVSVDSIDAARRALKANDFDLAVLDVALAKGSTKDFSADLRDANGKAIPVVLFSNQAANLAPDALAKPHTSIASLVATVRDRLAVRPSRISKEAL